MSVIAEFRVRSADLAMGAALADAPEIRLKLIQEVGTDPERPYLFVWVSGGDLDRFDERLRDDETVTDVERYLDLGEKILYRMRVTDATEVVSYPVWVELGGEQLEARYADGWWHNRMRLPDRDALGAIRDWCDDVGVEFVLDRIYGDDTASPTELTDPQREVLRLAYDAGYFSVPRDASMADIAAELDISGQAVSERLRRAHRRLVARHFDDLPTA
jgi:predicted DNA binding protein